MKLPIIIEESGDITLYDSVSDAELNMEAIDVNDGIYKGYDAEGRILNLSAADNIVRIDVAEKEPTHIEELEQILRKRLESIGKMADFIENGDISALIDECKVFKFVAPPSNNRKIIISFLKGMAKEIFRKKSGV